MIHSLSGGVITGYDKMLYVFVLINSGIDCGVKRWFISSFPKIAVGDKVQVPVGSGSAEGEVLRVETVTAQTAPFPVKRTQEIERVIK